MLGSKFNSYSSMVVCFPFELGIGHGLVEAEVDVSVRLVVGWPCFNNHKCRSIIQMKTESTMLWLRNTMFAYLS